MREAPALCVLFAADESFSPTQMERDLLRREGGRPGRIPAPMMEAACAVVLAVAGRFVEQCEGKRESASRCRGRAAARRAVGKRIPTFILLLLEPLVPFGSGERGFLAGGAGRRPGFRGESQQCCSAVTKRGGEASSQVLCGCRDPAPAAICSPPELSVQYWRRHRSPCTPQG